MLKACLSALQRWLPVSSLQSSWGRCSTGPGGRWPPFVSQVWGQTDPMTCLFQGRSCRGLGRPLFFPVDLQQILISLADLVERVWYLQHWIHVPGAYLCRALHSVVYRPVLCGGATNGLFLKNLVLNLGPAIWKHVFTRPLNVVLDVDNWKIY